MIASSKSHFVISSFRTVCFVYLWDIFFYILPQLKICFYVVFIVYEVVDPCLNCYNFYVLFRDKTFSGVSIDAKHSTPTEVVRLQLSHRDILRRICMVVAYVYYIHYHRHCIDRDSLPSTSFKDGAFVMIPNSVFDNIRRAVSPSSLQMLRIDRKGMINEVKLYMTSFVQKYSLTSNDVYTT